MAAIAILGIFSQRGCKRGSRPTEGQNGIKIAMRSIKAHRKSLKSSSLTSWGGFLPPPAVQAT
jgi:hypothetical protein